MWKNEKSQKKLFSEENSKRKVPNQMAKSIKRMDNNCHIPDFVQTLGVGGRSCLVSVGFVHSLVRLPVVMMSDTATQQHKKPNTTSYGFIFQVDCPNGILLPLLLKKNITDLLLSVTPKYSDSYNFKPI